jgi:predicted lipoprotein with Yx(FWY)xxD motif
MKHLFLTVSSLTAVLALAVGLNSALGANRGAGAGVKIGVANSALGRVLVDGRGRTLYLFENDKHGKSSCAGRCAAFWPPLIASGNLFATAGAKASLLGTTNRADGRLQVTYNHHPLYTFVKDTSKGETNGEQLDAFGAEWYAISSTGTKVRKLDADSGSSPVDAASGGYGY